MTGLAGGVTADERKLMESGPPEGDSGEAENQGGAAANDETGEQRQPANEDAKPDKDKARTVPFGALHEEREERKKAEARAERMERLFQDLVRGRQQPAERKEPVDDLPDISEKPVEHLDARTARLEREAKERKERETRENQQRADLMQIKGAIGRKEQIFAEQTPDYGEALAFARNLNIRRYYRATGSLEDAQQMAAKDEFDFAVANLKRGKNPARCAYNLAKDWGYKPGQHKGSTSGANDNKMSALEKGAEASRSTGAGRGAGDGEMTLEKLADMDPASPEFQKWRRKLIGPSE